MNNIVYLLSSHPVLVAAQAGLCLTWFETSNTGYLVTRLKFAYNEILHFANTTISICLHSRGIPLDRKAMTCKVKQCNNIICIKTNKHFIS